jgi:2-hydroxy-3-keto-5-methylthiopentenyl-1-phosphate phosphatase
LDFYIETVLNDIGVKDIKIFAAQAYFGSKGIKVEYIGPNGTQLKDNFKEAYIRAFLRDGYRVVYVGDGLSDICPAKQAHHIFARGELLNYCRETNVNCMPFTDFDDVVAGLEPLARE